MKTKMKINKIIALCFLSLLFSCNDLLEIEPKGLLTGEEVFGTAENIELALEGVYSEIAGNALGGSGGELYGGDWMIIPTLLSNRSTSSGGILLWDRSSTDLLDYSEFLDKSISKANTRISANWFRAYGAINTLNKVLASIDVIEDANVRSRVQGESLALRSLLYFDLVRLYGKNAYQDASSGANDGVPYITDPINGVDEVPTEVEREDVLTIYSNIESDLIMASSLLESLGSNSGRMSHFATQGVLMRLYMQQSDFDKAAESAEVILDDGAFSLTSTPNEAFNNVGANSNEDVFAIQQTTIDNSGSRDTRTGIVTFYSSLPESGLGTLSVLRPFAQINVFDEEGDARFTIQNADSSTVSASVDSAFYTNIDQGNSNFLSPGKFYRTGTNIPVIRLAEVHLTRAEAITEQSLTVSAQAVADLNVVRERANLATFQESDFPTFLALIDAIRIERRRELFLEGQYLHDLRRWEEDISSTISWDSPDIILPIPEAETMASGLE